MYARFDRFVKTLSGSQNISKCLCSGSGRRYCRFPNSSSATNNTIYDDLVSAASYWVSFNSGPPPLLLSTPLALRLEHGLNRFRHGLWDYILAERQFNSLVSMIYWHVDILLSIESILYPIIILRFTIRLNVTVILTFAMYFLYLLWKLMFWLWFRAVCRPV